MSHERIQITFVNLSIVCFVYEWVATQFSCTYEW